MKMLKALLLAVLLVWTALGAQAESAYTYAVSSDKTAVITGYTGTETDLTIPAQIDGYAITAIGQSAFYENETIRSVTVPEGVTAIRKSAFYKSSLRSITLPSTLETIGDYAFRGCQFEELVVPEGVTRIGERAFYNCYRLHTLTLPSTLQYIGDYAFQACDALQPQVLADTVTVVGEDVFDDFTWGVLYYQVQRDGTVIITDCDDYRKELEIPGEIDGRAVTAIRAEAFYACNKLETVVLPEGLIALGDDAFAGCDNLKSVTLPASLCEVGSHPFRSCEALADVTISPDNAVLAMVDGLLCDVRLGRVIGAMVGAGESEIVVPEQMTVVGANAFWKCEALVSVTLHAGVTEIGDGAFSECKYLTTIALPDGLERIGENAFSNCRSLEALTIPAGVTQIGDYAFYKCQRLTLSVTQGSAAEAYAADEDIPHVRMADGKAPILCGEYQYVVLEDGAAKIVRYTGDQAEVIVPDVLDGVKVSALAPDAFGDCAGLTRVVLGANVVSLEGNPFAGCDALADIEISANNPAFGVMRGMMIDKRSLCVMAYPAGLEETALEVMNGVTAIAPKAFAGCEALETITIPDSVAEIGEGAFEDCDWLTVVGGAGSAAQAYAEANDLDFEEQ